MLLPLLLDQYGAPGCTIVADAALWHVLQLDPAGSAHLPAPIPNDNTLRGVVFSMQIGAIDKKPKRPFPMVVTNGIEVKIQ